MNNNTKYQMLMANLLNIDTFDSSLYSSIDNEKYFDVLKNFGEETFDHIYNNFNINCTISDIANRMIATKVYEAKNKNEVIAIFEDYNKRIPENLFKMLGTNFEKAKAIIVASQETEFQKSVVKWKKILNKAQNINIETNIWPLHIGFFYISIKTENKTIYAPLFFKEILVEVKNSLVTLSSSSDIRVNSKLVTFLNQEGFSLNVDSFDFNNLSIREVFESFKNAWKPLFNMPLTLKEGIKNLTIENIENSSIEFYPGIVLGFYNVSSGYLWNQMKKIIENDEFDEILNPNFNKNLYREKVNRVIFDNKFKLFKIQETNFSQDVATISSLYQDTIIWGPPGTGKSQTISNLITNIMTRGYTALVVSQKKAALDVLRSRLKKLSIFCLFALNDKNLRPENFYKPLREFIHLLENYENSNVEEGLSVFSDEDESYVDNVNLIKQTKNIDNIINFYSAVMNGNFSVQTYENLKKMDHNLKYNQCCEFSDKKLIIKKLYEKNFNKKCTIFSIIPKIIKNMAEIILNDQSLMTIDIDEALKYVNLVSFEEITNFEKQYKKILNKKTNYLNDDKNIVKMLLEKTFDRMTNFSDEQKMQYTSFAMAIRTGHLKPYKFFHKHKEMIKILFPIIITTPELDLSMWSKQEFDFAILDESSQMFIEKGIPILYLAKRKILAGDSQQMQPTRWFSATYSFDEEDDFGNIESLLDYARARGVYSLLLDKNYRSKKATLMTFSSKHFYESKLDVIDNYELSVSNEKAIEVFQVDGTWDNSMNVAEGEKVIELCKQNLEKYNKIIILVFNVKQQEYLFNRIFGNDPELEDALNSEKVVLKNIENIQGDEADLVIMSVVYDKNTALYNTYVARKGGKNALNVAISRAKEKVFVVKSIYADDIEITDRSTADMIVFKEWLKFLDLSIDEQKNYLDEVEDFLATKIISLPEDIKFKVDVLDELRNFINDKNLQFQTDYSVGTKTIDIVLINKLNNKLIQGFILDNFLYKNDYRKYLIFRDNIKFLESKEYPIITISEIEWPIIKNKIFAYLEALISQQQVENQAIIELQKNNMYELKEYKEVNFIPQSGEEDMNIETKLKDNNIVSLKENNIKTGDETAKNNDHIDDVDDFYVAEMDNHNQIAVEIDEFEEQNNYLEIHPDETDDIDSLTDDFKVEQFKQDDLEVAQDNEDYSSDVIMNLNENTHEEFEDSEVSLNNLSSDFLEDDTYIIDQENDETISKTEINDFKINSNKINNKTDEFNNIELLGLSSVEENDFEFEELKETNVRADQEKQVDFKKIENTPDNIIDEFGLVDTDEKTTEFEFGD
ncbi:AAA domain-containing protein [Mycoplasma sp. 125]|uniref:AAA domain-containing protein n=1 Tax=Mycoplasma sp. 125 TaxID=3447505 RepID=UPI003F658457